MVTRSQVLAAGRTRKWLECRVRSGRWQRVLPGVFATHDGPLGWRSRAWAAVLYAGPGAALAGRAAAFDLGIVRRAPDVVDVAVPSGRRVRDQPRVRVTTRIDLLDAVARTNPPRTRADETVVDLLPGCCDDDAVVALLCDGLRVGADARTLHELLAARPRWKNRRLALDALQECETGVESVLERRFHRDVLRRHGLPGFRRPGAREAGRLLDPRRRPVHPRPGAGRARRPARAPRGPHGRGHLARQRGRDRHDRDHPAVPVAARGRVNLPHGPAGGAGAAEPGLVGPRPTVRSGVPRRTGRLKDPTPPRGSDAPVYGP